MAYRDETRPDEDTCRWFESRMRQAAAGDGIIIDCSRMEGSADYSLHFEAVADGRLVHVKDDVVDGVRQVPFFRITDKGRAWIAQVPR